MCRALAVRMSPTHTSFLPVCCALRTPGLFPHLSAFVSVSVVFIYFVVSHAKHDAALSAMDWQALILATFMGFHVLEIVHMGSVLAACSSPLHLRHRIRQRMPAPALLAVAHSVACRLITSRAHAALLPSGITSLY